MHAIAAPILTTAALIAVTAMPTKPSEARDLLLTIGGLCAAGGMVVALF